MTPARERKANERKAKKAVGLVRIEAWVPAEKAEFIKWEIVRMTDPDTYYKRMADLFVEKGLSSEVAAGVVANIRHECELPRS